MGARHTFGRVVVGAQHADHSVGAGLAMEGGEVPQIAEHDRDLDAPPVDRDSDTPATSSMR